MQGKRTKAPRKATRGGVPSHSLYPGVTFDGVPRRRKPWRARITTKGRVRSLGTFATELEAAAAYKRALNIYPL